MNLYHLCFELGRFPAELPVGLPDEQLVLMTAYTHVRADLQSGKTTEVDLGARAAEKQLQADEAAAWKNRRGGVT